jgi:pSer/pThr/pTyr-binding forkhead associated (FHA) protein
MDLQSLIGTLLAVAAAWFGWLKREEIARVLKTAAANLRSAKQQPLDPIASPSGAPAPESDVDDSAATVVIQRQGFGSITCITGALAGKRWEIPLQGLSIGRDPRSDIVIDDSRVSVNHAHVLAKQGHVFVVDTNSKNGVFLNDFRHRVTGEAMLSPGDTVMLSASDAAHFIFRT